MRGLTLGFDDLSKRAKQLYTNGKNIRGVNVGDFDHNQVTLSDIEISDLVTYQINPFTIKVIKNRYGNIGVYTND